MEEISLKALLEAGCHFGHKVDRWHPKAETFIFQKREGVHIIDLVKTREGLKKAAEYVRSLGEAGKVLLVVATKRQAKGVVTEAAKQAGLPYLTNRWIGGFVTNFEEVKKNIEKMNGWRTGRDDGTWGKMIKHEAVKLGKDLRKHEIVYEGVASVRGIPDAMFVVDVKKEMSAVKEAIRRGVKLIGIVDTNSDPTPIDYVIPANDDAVGSIQFIVNYITNAYKEGVEMRKKAEGKAALKLAAAPAPAKPAIVNTAAKVEAKKPVVAITALKEVEKPAVKKEVKKRKK